MTEEYMQIITAHLNNKNEEKRSVVSTQYKKNLIVSKYTIEKALFLIQQMSLT